MTKADERDLVAAVAHLVNLLNRRLAPILEKSNVTPQQWGVLSAIGAAGEPITLAAVARRLAVTKQNMTGMIDRLEQLALVERLEDPNDLRSSRVQLTRRGRGVIEKATPVYEEWLESLSGEQVTRAVNRLISRLEES
ncbi:MAG TPA: MarR family transcriptional regulator [Thermoanaerobaculia bacterium]|nr:MarR family transcriptional regulator [Thermoanaerobaculia bacterium]